jgi:hypothetical protein
MYFCETKLCGFDHTIQDNLRNIACVCHTFDKIQDEHAPDIDFPYLLLSTILPTRMTVDDIFRELKRNNGERWTEFDKFLFSKGIQEDHVRTMKRWSQRLDNSHGISSDSTSNSQKRTREVEEQSESECGICYARPKIIKLLPCTHELCEECVLKIESEFCPYCRSQVVTTTSKYDLSY